MIQEIEGDLLCFPANILCHQTNYYGVMDGGIAAAIRMKILTDEQYNEYKDYCMYFGRQALGTVLYSTIIPGERYIANCLSQRDFGAQEVLTDYEAFRQCLAKVEQTAKMAGWSVALPGYMGCGIAGGDWDIVSGIIHDIFAQSSVPLTVVYWSGGRYQ